MRKVLLATIAALLSTTTPSYAASVYVALGDSISFGETDLSYVPSDGDRGYVSQFADTLAFSDGGVRPDVVNLAIDGETAASFQSNVGRTPPVVGRGDVPLQAENLNYAGSMVAQGMLFASKVADEKAAGNSIDNVTITLGFNELAALASLSPSDALAAITPTIANYRTNYAEVLTQVRTLLPTANLYLLGYFNPFPADPSSPGAPIFNTGGMALNATVQSLAGEFGARFVDTVTPFLGNEAAYTYLDEQSHGATVAGPFGGVLPIGNVHPNTAGYTAIAGVVSAAGAVPEPTVWLTLIIGFGVVGSVQRRARQPASVAA
ncbi:MAG: GDSL-type esterase/lipase family protein [Janthinobacterium lividum]